MEASSASAARRRSTSSVRLVTSSNHDLEAAVRDGRFRDDLLYRLNVVTVVAAAAARACRSTSRCLAQHFLTQLAGAAAPMLTAGRDRADAGVSVAGQHSRAAKRDRARRCCWRATASARSARRICRCSRRAWRVARGRGFGDDARGAGAPAHRRGAGCRRTGIRATRRRSSGSRRRRCIGRFASTDFEPTAGAVSAEQAVDGRGAMDAIGDATATVAAEPDCLDTRLSVDNRL